MNDEPQGNFDGYEPVTKALHEQVRERERRVAELEAEKTDLALIVEAVVASWMRKVAELEAERDTLRVAIETHQQGVQFHDSADWPSNPFNRILWAVADVENTPEGEGT
jgi:hypothetical protein